MNLPPGYTSRPATPDDLDEVAALIDEWDLVYFGEAGPNRAGVQYDWSAPWVELARDARVIQTANGHLAAYAKHDSPVPSERYEVDAFVHPSHEGRGIGSAIVSWSEGKTRSELAPGAHTRLWSSTGTPNVSGLRLLEDHGYHLIRTFWQMRIDLGPSFDAGPLPEQVTVRRHQPGVDDRAVHAAIDEAFTTHFGYFRESFEDWQEHQFADETFDLARGFVAEIAGQVVGASINGEIDGTGWIYELGVLGKWQRRGIGRALLRHSLAMFAADGIRVARLGVDTENETGALGLYRSVGMRPVREWRVFEKSIRPG